MEGVLDRIGRAYWIENGRSVLASCSPTRSVAGEGRGGKEAGSSRGSVVEECKEAILAKGASPSKALASTGPPCSSAVGARALAPCLSICRPRPSIRTAHSHTPALIGLTHASTDVTIIIKT